MVETREHCLRVSRLAGEFGEQLNMKASDVEVLRVAGLYHDFGKYCIDKSILGKAGKLTKYEYDEIKKHPLLGHKTLRNSNLSDVILRIIKEHHERPDGKGYPQALRNNQIHKFSKIIALCDCYDAMRMKRCYKEEYSNEKCIDEIIKNAGKQFDYSLAFKFIEYVMLKEEGKERRLIVM